MNKCPNSDLHELMLLARAVVDRAEARLMTDADYRNDWLTTDLLKQHGKGAGGD